MTEIIIWPFAWLLRTFYTFFQNYGIAIILFSVVIKLIFLPFQMKSKRSMMRSTRLAPLMKELEKKHGEDKAKYQQEVSKLYKEEGVNPMSGCLWSLLPLAIMLIMYPVIREPLTSFMGIGAEAFEKVKELILSMGGEVSDGAFAQIGMVDFIHNNFSAFAGISDKLIDIDFSFLGMNLSTTPQWQVWNFDWSNSVVFLPQLGLFSIPLISAGLSYLSMKVSMAANPAAEAQQGPMKSMNLMMPLMSVFIGFAYPAAMGVYWLMSSLLAMIQDVILNKHYGKILDAEDAERNARRRAQEEEMERKRLETERLRALGETERNKNTSKKKLQTVEKVKEEERLAKERAEEKAARRAALGITKETPESQVGTRKYARGRAYVSDRYTNPEGADEATRDAAALADIDEEVDKEFDEQERTENSEESSD